MFRTRLGVLEVLQSLRIPVDCVAGTSMGALIAGAWASGRSLAHLRQEMAKADWDDLFQDNADFADLSFSAPAHEKTPPQRG